MNFPYECFVINLDRQPQRLAEFRRWNDGCGLDIQRFPAVDGAKATEAQRRTVRTDEAYAVNSIKGSIGCSLSHRALWQYAADKMKPIVIFEDDAVLRADIGEVLFPLISGLRQLWDIILLGYNTNGILNFHPDEKFQWTPKFSPYPSTAELSAFRASTEEVKLRRLSHTYGLCGYVISPLAAKRLLKEVFPLENRLLLIPGIGFHQEVGLDHTLNGFYGSLSAYMCWPPLVLPPNYQPGSNTRPTGLG